VVTPAAGPGRRPYRHRELRARSLWLAFGWRSASLQLKRYSAVGQLHGFEGRLPNCEVADLIHELSVGKAAGVRPHSLPLPSDRPRRRSERHARVAHVVLSPPRAEVLPLHDRAPALVTNDQRCHRSALLVYERDSMRDRLHQDRLAPDLVVARRREAQERMTMARR
jgi:hypothetical protein